MTPSIQDIRSRIKALFLDETLFVAVLILLVGIASFGLGRSSVMSQQPETTTEAAVSVSEAKPAKLQREPTVLSASALADVASGTPDASQQYVGSKNGTKFHLPSCPGASQIKEENKVYFTSKQDAYSKGYTEAANCKGI